MEALDFIESISHGEVIVPKSQVTGHNPVGNGPDMICDCDSDGECCGY